MFAGGHKAILIGHIVHAVEQAIVTGVLVVAFGAQSIALGLLLNASTLLAENAVLRLVAGTGIRLNIAGL